MFGSDRLYTKFNFYLDELEVISVPYLLDLLQKSIFAPPTPPIPRGDPMPPPILGGECIQSPPELGDLGGIPGFMQEV
jgi:hypothetical protein